jgi:hypothetical protein
MTSLVGRRNTAAALLAGASAAGFWAGWGLGLVPPTVLLSILGAGLIAACLLLLLSGEFQGLQGLAGTMLGLCPAAALLVVLAGATGLEAAAGALRLWPLILALFAAVLALSLLPGLGTRAVFARAGLVLAAALTLAELSGATALADRWILRSPAHLAIAYVACLVLAAQARIAVSGPAAADEARMIAGMTQLLPLLGFAGTVWGIMVALQSLPAIFATVTPSTEALQTLLGGLGTAFETTLLGLLAAVVVAVVALLLPDEEPPA